MSTAFLYALVGVGLFSLGLYALIVHAHLLRKILALNVMANGVFLVLVALAKRTGEAQPDAVPHAMVITGCHVEEGGGVTRWRVENSWGEDRGEKGYLLMTSEWFKEFVFEIVVDKKVVPQEVLDTGDLEPVLPAGDPLGALAVQL